MESIDQAPTSTRWRLLQLRPEDYGSIFVLLYTIPTLQEICVFHQLGFPRKQAYIISIYIANSRMHSLARSLCSCNT